MKRRIDIDGSGFLSEEIGERLAALPEIRGDLASAATAIVRFANELAAALPIYTPHESIDEKQRIIVVVLLVRLIEVVESILILSAYGVRQELDSLFRVFLDAYFLIANVCRDPNFVAVYMRTDLPNRLKLLNVSATHNHEIFRRLNSKLTDEVRSALRKEIDDQKIATFNSHAYAERVDCSHIYDSMYRLTSAAVHTTPRCLEQYVQADSEGNVSTIVHHSDIGTVHRVLFDTSWFLLKALEGSFEVFSISGGHRLTALKERLDACAAALDEVTNGQSRDAEN